MNVITTYMYTPQGCVAIYDFVICLAPDSLYQKAAQTNQIIIIIVHLFIGVFWHHYVCYAEGMCSTEQGIAYDL